MYRQNRLVKFWIICFICLVNDLTISGNVTSGPTITGITAINEGEGLTLTCNAVCDNGTCAFTFDTDMKGTTTNSNKLVNDDVKRNDGAKYSTTCTVTDDDNTPEKSKEHLLDVYYGPDSVKITSPTVPLYEDKWWETFKCESVGCHPACSVSWEKGSENLVTANNVAEYFTDKVVRRSNDGVYTCKANNAKTSKEKNGTTTIIVYYPPDVTVTWDQDKNTLTCTAKGKPDSYTFKQWNQMVNNVQVRDDLNGQKVGGTFTYKFKSPTYQDTGNYTCYVNNNIDKTNKYEDKHNTATVLINDTPVLISPKESYNVSKGDPLNMLIDVYSKSEIQPTMYHTETNKNDTNVKINSHRVKVTFYGKIVTVDGFRITASFTEMLEEYFGLYTVTISNTYGSTQTSITIQPKGAPDPPSELRIRDITHNTLAVHLKSGFYNGANQTFIVEYKTGGSDTNWVKGPELYAGDKKNLTLKATIVGLEPSTFYMFRSYGYNVFDNSTFTDLVNVTTAEVPFNYAQLGGAIGGVVAVVVVVLIVVIGIIIIRKKKNDKTVKEIQRVNMSEIIREHDVHNNEYTADPRTEGEEPYVNEVAMQSDSVIYQNTEVKATPMNSRRTPKLDSFRITKTTKGNDKVDQPAGGELSPLEGGYIDFNETHENTNEESYMNLNMQKVKPGAVEEAYIDMDFLKGIAQATKVDDAEVTYLDMDKDKLEDYQNVANYKIITVKPPVKEYEDNEETYLAMEMKPKPKGKTGKENSTKKDYMNVSEYKKPSPALSSKNKKGQKSAAANMSEDLKRESVPDYVAPPPPSTKDPAGGRFQKPPQEDDYMNIRLGNK